MTVSKKILVVAESIDVEDSSGSKGRVTLIENLSKIGFEVIVYHYTRLEINLEGVECISIPEHRRNKLFLLSRLERQLRYKLKIYLNKPLEKIFGFSFTLLNDRNSIAYTLKEINFKPDLVLTVSKGGSFRPHHALLKIPELHDKWMAYIHDPYPMHWYPPPYPWFEPGYAQKEKFMKEMARKAKYLSFPSQLLLEWMGEKYKPFREKGLIIPHQIVQGKQIEKDSEELINSLSFDSGKFNILHAGNLIQGREPFGLIEGFKKFLSNNPGARGNARLIFMGGENYYSEYLISEKVKNPEIIVTNKKLNFKVAKRIQNSSTINVILEAKSNLSPFLPGKFPHCIEANQKILLLSPPVSESRRLLGDEYEFWSEIDDAESIAKLINKLYLLWQNDPGNLKLNRPDLEEYLSTTYLKKTMMSLVELNPNLDE